VEILSRRDVTYAVESFILTYPDDDVAEGFSLPQADGGLKPSATLNRISDDLKTAATIDLSDIVEKLQ